MPSEFYLDNKKVGKDCATYIIAEIGQAHDGSLGIAHSYIDAVHNAGADAIKFQTHIAEAESSPGEPFRINFSYEDKTRYDYWKRMEFSYDQWKGLRDHCKDLGLTFLSSPFSQEAIDLLENLEVPGWKVGSGEVNNPNILNAMTATGKPILLSSGMSGWNEIESSLLSIQETKSPVALFQCTTKYPTQLEDVGLNVIDEMRSKFNIPIGLSNHTGSLTPSLVSIAQGIDLLEIHVVFHKDLFGPDTKSSLTIEQLHELVNFRNEYEVLRSFPVDKDKMSEELSELKELFNKSLFIKNDIMKGSTLTNEDLIEKKPGTGIPVRRIGEYIGKEVLRDLKQGHMLTEEDLKK